MSKQLTVPLPSNFRVEHSSDELKIIIRWFTPKLWMPTLLCLFLDGLVSVFIVALIAAVPRASLSKKMEGNLGKLEGTQKFRQFL